MTSVVKKNDIVNLLTLYYKCEEQHNDYYKGI